MKIPSISEIVHAWKISMNPTPEQQEIAESRAAVCETCEAKEFIMLTRTFICGDCGCPIRRKIYTPKGPDGCPREKWPR